MDRLKDLWKLVKAYWFKAQHNIMKYPLLLTQVEDILDRKITTYKGKMYYEGTDGYYMTCDKKTMEGIIKLMPIRFGKYTSDVHDCDNFAREFWGLAGKLFPQLPIGYCHVKTENGLHAANFCIYKDEAGNPSFIFIEPQTGEMKYFNWKMYLAII